MASTAPDVSHVREIINDIGERLLELRESADLALELQRLRETAIVQRDALNATRGEVGGLREELRKARETISRLTTRVVDKVNYGEAPDENIVDRCAKAAFCAHHKLDPSDAEHEWMKYIDKVQLHQGEGAVGRFFILAKAVIQEYERVNEPLVSAS
jgi:predicted nuclease with TOPRIM domain